MAVPVEHSAEATSNPPAPKRRLRKWLVRIAIFRVGFVLLVGIILQMALLTGLPKSIVVGQVEKGLGLRMGVERVSTGWFGRTSLYGVKIALPLSDQSFVEVPEMRVRHTSLIAMIFGRPLLIKEIDLDKPVVSVWQDASGRWNLLEVAELLARVGGKNTGEQTANSDTPALPRLGVKELAADIRDNQGRKLRVEPINVTGSAETPVTYAYDVEIPSGKADVPPHLSLRGRVAPGGSWGHSVHVWVNDVDPWIAVWKPGFNTPLSLDGNWSGELAATGVKGFLQISDARYADFHAVGGLSVSRLEGLLALSPVNLRVKTPVPAVSELTLARGEVSYDGTVAKFARVQFGLLGGPAEMNGWFEPSINQGALEAYWQDVKTGPVRQSGKLNAAYSNPSAANMTLDVLASSSGTAPDGPFEAVAKISATGRSLTDLAWRIDAPQLAWHRPQPILLDGVSATGNYRQDEKHQVVRLNSVALAADARLSGTGVYDLSTKEGELHLSGQDWPVQVIEGTRLAFALDATGKGVAAGGDSKKIAPVVELSQFFLRSGETSLMVKGSYDGREPKPVSAEVVFENQPGNSPSPSESTLLRGFVRGNAKLSGTLLPLKVGIEGRLFGRNAVVLNHVIGDLTTGLKGDIDYQKATIRADAIPFLDGLWTLGATYVTHENDKPVYATEVDVSVEHLPLRKVSEFLDVPRMEGKFDGRWYVYYPRLKPDPTKMIITGGGAIGNVTVSSFVADNVTFKTTLKNGQFSIDPIEVTRGSYGKIQARASTSVDQFRRILVGVELAQFPVDFGSALAVQTTGGSKQIVVMLPDAKSADPLARKLRVEGEVTTRTAVALSQQPLGEIRSTTLFRGRTAYLTKMDGDLLGGTIDGSGSADIDDLNQSKLWFEWKGVQSDRFVRMYPQLKGFGGTFSGNARLQPARMPRPLEPMQIDAYLHSNGGHWRTIRLGDGQVHAFANPETYQFIASESEVTSMQLGGGSIDFWFAGSRHIDTAPTPEGVEKETGVTISNLVNVTLNNLQVDQFVQAFDPKHAPGLGKLNGAIYTLSAPKTQTLANIASDATTQPATTAPSTTAPTATAASIQQQTMLAHILATTTLDGDLRLDEGDLGKLGVIAFLYNAMHLGQDVRNPTGHGNVALHMEQGLLRISNLYYFNRGVEVRGVVNAESMWAVPDNTISGSVVGTVRPLKNIKLPLFAEADALLNQLQGGLTGVEFKGPLIDPVGKGSIKLISLSQFGAELKNLLLGEIGANRGQ